MDSLQKVFKGQIEGEASVAHSKRFQKGSSSETKSAPSFSGFKKIYKKKGAKGKRLAAAVKGKEKEAKVVDKGKSFLCNVNGHCKRNCLNILMRRRMKKKMMVLRIHCPMTMNNVDKDQWVEVMDLEMESIYFNSMWELVVLPEGVKPIWYKWIYKRKRDSAGKVQTFKTRLVAKRYEVHLSKEQYPKTPQEVKDMRRIPYASVVGIEVASTPHGLFQCQSKYAKEILIKGHMLNASKFNTPMAVTNSDHLLNNDPTDA
ncbi:gag/pol protein [Cucumis melo var. makuwa]|uniref:Gag/pol protein n=1 Tax=Cucumis melo var. makuwa TaxID=1194695 RepID=A0A5D3BLV4_CUCMM|nr:gag/pol protein [Cucumis melo var. makuwa]